MEEWRDIEGFEGLYQISNDGKVLSLNYSNRGYAKLLTPKCGNKGYLWVQLFNKGKVRNALIHRLVAEAFIPNTNNLPQINHKDENPKNNSVENLEWCDAAYNIRYSFKLHTDRNKWNKRIKTKTRYHLKVAQYDKNGVFIRQWSNSRTIFLETGMSDWSIAECCRGNRKTAYGFIWRYVS